MGDLQVGSKVWCTPTRIKKHDQTIVVDVPEADREVTIPIRDVFPNWHADSGIFYPASVVYHDPYNIVRVDRPFTAKVTEKYRLAVSRTERIAELWGELEAMATRRAPILAQVTGQNASDYFVSVEGNIFAGCNKTALVEYWRSKSSDVASWHKHAPFEGDTVLADVAFAASQSNQLNLDLVTPLERLGSGEFDPGILRLFGSRGTDIDCETTNITVDPGPPLPLATLAIDHSRKLDAQRNDTRVLVIDDKQAFATHLARLLSEMGYEGKVVPPPKDAGELTKHCSSRTVFVIDAKMDPPDGVSLISELTAGSPPREPRHKCILMSALLLHEHLDARGGISLGEAAKHLDHLCLFWDKSPQNLEAGLRELDNLILGFDDRIRSQPLFSAASSKPPAPSPVTAQAPLARDVEETGDLESILDELKDDTGAKWAALFEMDRNLWRVDVLAGEEFLKEKSMMSGAQSYLPNSSIRDISYQVPRLLFEDHVADEIPRFRNLLRFFARGDIHEPVNRAGFMSVAATRLSLGTSKRYSLFIFHPQRDRFDKQVVDRALKSAAERLELVLFRQITTTQIQINQPFMLEGQARTGLRHDAAAQLTNIQMAARNLLSGLQSADTPAIKEGLQEIRTLAVEAHQRIEESLRQFRPHADATQMDLRRGIELAERIASGVAKHRDPHKKVLFATEYPDGDELSVTGDPQSLQRVLENLLVNAVEHGLAFVRQTLSILVEVQRLDDENFPFAILVHDNGPGIHGIDRAQVFEMLFSTKEDGHGMGLAVTRAIADQMGLKLDIVASAVLAGTTFRVKVPREMTPRLSMWRT